jgi:hypothetical protein
MYVESRYILIRCLAVNLKNCDVEEYIDQKGSAAQTLDFKS